MGVIWAENSAIATGMSQQLQLTDGALPLEMVAVTLPAGAYMPGTRVTLRWVASLGLTTNESLELGSLSRVGPQDAALQLLPSSPGPASPLPAIVLGSGPGSYDVLHANECDASWQIVGTARAGTFTTSEASSPSLSFEMSGPGLWTLGQSRTGMDAGTVTPGAAPSDASCPTSSSGKGDGGQPG